MKEPQTAPKTDHDIWTKAIDLAVRVVLSMKSTNNSHRVRNNTVEECANAVRELKKVRNV